MQSIVKRTAHVAYAVAIAMALSFGAAQAFGTTASDPCAPNGAIIGSCDILGGNEGCQAACDLAGGSVGWCDQSPYYCCHCAYR
jgi:hypothetical protein